MLVQYAQNLGSILSTKTNEQIYSGRKGQGIDINQLPNSRDNVITLYCAFCPGESNKMAKNFISPPFSKYIFPIKVTLGDQSKLTNRRGNSDSSVSGVSRLQLQTCHIHDRQGHVLTYDRSDFHMHTSGQVWMGLGW